MSHNINYTTVNVAWSISVAFMVCSFIAWLYFWGAGIRAERLAVNELRASTCYQEFEWSDAHKTSWVSLQYCGEATQ